MSCSTVLYSICLVVENRRKTNTFLLWLHAGSSVLTSGADRERRKKGSVLLRMPSHDVVVQSFFRHQHQYVGDGRRRWRQLHHIRILRSRWLHSLQWALRDVHRTRGLWHYLPHRSRWQWISDLDLLPSAICSFERTQHVHLQLGPWRPSCPLLFRPVHFDHLHVGILALRRDCLQSLWIRKGKLYVSNDYFSFLFFSLESKAGFVRALGTCSSSFFILNYEPRDVERGSERLHH